MPTRRYDHHRLSPLVSTRNDEGPIVAAWACGNRADLGVSVQVGPRGAGGQTYPLMPTPLHDAFVDFAGYAHDWEHFREHFKGTENEQRCFDDLCRAEQTCARMGVDHEQVWTAADAFVEDHIGLIRSVGRALVPHLIDSDTVPPDVVASVLRRHERRIRAFDDYARDWIRLDWAASSRNSWGTLGAHIENPRV